MIGDKLKKLRGKKTQDEIAKHLGISRVRYSHYENNIRKPDPDMIRELANYYKVTADYLLNDNTDIVHLNEYRKYGLEPIDDTKMRVVAVLGTIRAGEPIDRIENIEGYIAVDPALTKSKELFALKVSGESMSGDGIHDGYIVVVEKTPEVDSSDIAVVAVNGNYATLKRVKQQGDMCMLIPSNRDMQPFMEKSSEITILGRVIEFRGTPRKLE